MAVNLHSSRFDTLYDYLGTKTCRRLPFQSNQRIKARGQFVILNKYVLSGLISIDLNTMTNFGALAARLNTDVGTPSTKVLRDGFGNIVNLVYIKSEDGGAINSIEGEKVYGLLQAGMNKVDGTEISNDVQITFVDKSLNTVTLDEQYINFSVITIYSQRWKYDVELFGSGEGEGDEGSYEDNGHFWVGEEVPTIDNYPANKWGTELARSNHLNDIYYQMNGDVKVATYKFDRGAGTFYWRQITDQELEQLRQDVTQQVQSKMKVWMWEPIPPYKEGDLWLNERELMVCINTRQVGSFEAGDWEKATKYTDDTKVNEVEINLNETISELETVKTTVKINTETIRDTRVIVDGLSGEVDIVVEELEIQQTEINQRPTYDETEDMIQETAPMTVQVLSSNGSIFKNGQISTTLSVKVWKQNRDITAAFLDSQFRWERVSSDPEGDEVWNNLPAHKNTKSVVITNADVSVRATFNVFVSTED